MRKRRKWTVIVYGSIVVLIAIVACIAAAADGSSKRSAIIPSEAEEAAKAISLVTGTAISPMLGVGAVGAWEYFTTSQGKKENLHWYANPMVWLPALLLVGAVAAKDTIGTALPPGFKKPLDAVEVIENKISGFIAGGAFIPLIGSIFISSTEVHTPASTLGMMSQADSVTGNLIAASVFPAEILNVFVLPLALGAFALVWLAGHAINVLILLSPLGAIDAALKSLRIFLMSVVAVTSFVNPYAGAFLSLIVVILSYFIAGWSFRLTIIGSIFVWDILTGRRRRFAPSNGGNWVFTASKIEDTPIHTYGKLLRSESGNLIFEYRPWLIMQMRKQHLPAGSYAVGRGLLCPEIRGIDPTTKKSKTIFLLSPRFRTHENQVVEIYGFAGVQDVGILRGFKAAWTWLLGWFGSKNANKQAVPSY